MLGTNTLDMASNSSRTADTLQNAVQVLRMLEERKIRRAPPTSSDNEGTTPAPADPRAGDSLLRSSISEGIEDFRR